MKAIFLIGTSEVDAIRLERFIKKQKSISLIKKLIDPSFVFSGLLAQLVRVPYDYDSPEEIQYYVTEEPEEFLILYRNTT